MNDAEAQALLARLLDNAKRAGADAADALMYESVSSNVTCRLGNLEDVERSESRDLGLRMIFGKRQASVSSTDMATAGLDELVERCAAMARAAPEDPWCGLAPTDRLARAPFADLDPGDFEEPDTATLKARAEACEAAALASPRVVNSMGASAGYGEGRRWFATSAGFFGAAGGSRHSLSVAALAQDEHGMERDYDWDSKTHIADMRAPEEIGARAGARAAERLSPRRVKSGAAPVIFEKRLAPSLLGSLSGAINGAAIARGVSFLKDRLGEPVFAKGVNVIDDPHIRRGLASSPFDGEGVGAARLSVIDDGVLRTWLLNSAQARQLGLETNGRAGRGTGGPPGSGPTNLFLEAGGESLDALMARAGSGLIVTDMFGPQINPNTGDYSVGCSGFWFEGGARAYPVNEITIAGNLLAMFARIEPADDLEFTGAINAPSVLVGEMTIAGD
jgi:PmbA protein